MKLCMRQYVHEKPITHMISSNYLYSFLKYLIPIMRPFGDVDLGLALLLLLPHFAEK